MFRDLKIRSKSPLFSYLFADAELTKNSLQQIIGWDFARYFAQCGKGVANIHGNKIARDARGHTPQYIAQTDVTFLQSLKMADVGDDDAGLICWRPFLVSFASESN